MGKPVTVELLVPARDAATAFAAILHGADAVYMGASSHGARAAAANTTDDIARVAEFAHRYDARVYATVNTLVYDSELRSVERLVTDLYRAGADALIVQDLGILRLDIPPIELHASTQCDIRTPEKARFLESVGFSQLVLPREFTLDEISAVRAATTVPLEAFVHGALCVCYSGDCQASFVTTGRSANRGECAQLCRLAYDLTDLSGHRFITGKHLLSLRDLNRLDDMAGMLEAGITSFKIEGRLKDAGYVKNVVGAYRRRLDDLIDASAGRFGRASAGRVELSFEPDVAKSFNRGFTTYFLDEKAVGSKPMACHDTPKWTGERIGRIKAVSGTRMELDSEKAVNNGDGLGYFSRTGRFEGFRVNRANGHTIIAARPLPAAATGCVVYRNHDKRRCDMLAGDTARRLIDIDMTIRAIPGGLALDVSCDGCAGVSVTLRGEFGRAKTPQADARRRVLSKLGDTPYAIRTISDHAGDVFVPASQIAALRRDAVAAMDLARKCRRKIPMRRQEDKDIIYAEQALTYHDNVANVRAAQFYSEHGVCTIAPALEVAESVPDEPVVMTTRYCLRRELGACLRSKNGTALPGDLALRAPGIVWKLEFDCKRCRMRVRKSNGK